MVGSFFTIQAYRTVQKAAAQNSSTAPRIRNHRPEDRTGRPTRLWAVPVEKAEKRPVQ